MAIELHCPLCNKLIRAPDNAGGKRGKCPYCAGSVYIPMPPDEQSEIPLAPVDETVEKRKERLRKESTAYAAQVDHAQKPKYDTGPPASGASSSYDVSRHVETSRARPAKTRPTVPASRTKSSSG